MNVTTEHDAFDWLSAKRVAEHGFAKLSFKEKRPTSHCLVHGSLVHVVDENLPSGKH